MLCGRPGFEECVTRADRQTGWTEAFLTTGQGRQTGNVCTAGRRFQGGHTVQTLQFGNL